MRFHYLLILSFLSACGGEPATTLVSEKPASSDVSDIGQLHTKPSRINIRTRIRMSDVQSILETEIPPKLDGTGEQRQCKRVLGIKLCGTAQWQYDVERGVINTAAAQGDRLALTVPLAFRGSAGIQGDVAKALNLSKLDFDGALISTIKLSLDLDDQWCPVVSTDVDYQWQKKPKVDWVAGLDMDLSSHLDKAINKQLAGLDEKLKESIDCEEFKTNIAQHWRNYTFPIDIAENTRMHLNLQPVSFAFSGMRTDAEYTGVSFTLLANTLLESTPADETPQSIPDLIRSDYQPGQSVFELLIRSNYDHLEELAKPVVLNKTFSNDSAAGKVDVTVNDLALSGNNDGITIKLDFDAKLPGGRKTSKGEVYLTASPEIDLLSQEISLTNIRLSKVLDSTMWNAIASLFEAKIISAIEAQTLWDVHEQIEELEAKLLAQLNDPSQTHGLEISAETLQIALVDLVPEQTALAALLNVETDMDIVIPDTVLKKR